MKFVILIGIMAFLLIKQVDSQTINSPLPALSSAYTLVSNVTYPINMSFGPIDIPASTKLLFQFSTHFTITNLTNCQYSLNGISFTTAACSPSYNSQNTVY